MNWMGDEELTDDDLKFLDRWQRMGKSDTADSEYKPEQEFEKPEQEGGAQESDRLVGEYEGESEAESDEIDHDKEGDHKDGEQGEEIDESKMDLSNIEADPHIQESESSSEDELGEQDDELDMEDSEPDHLESGEGDPEDIQEDEDDLEYDPQSDEKVKDEFEGDERANTESEIEDLDEYERQRKEAEREHDLDETEDESEQKLNAEDESDFEGDAQQELEDHLNSEETPKEPNDVPENGDTGESQQEDGSSDGDSADQGDDQGNDQQDTEQPHEQQDTPKDKQEGQEGIFEGMPDHPDACENHCEDNPTGDDQEHEECPYCSERIARERELWGPIAKDKNDQDILPGDKLRVVIPMPFTTMGAILTANVPNQEVDPIRVAESTAGEIDPDMCWLSGRQISRFTGWHMAGNGAIWTFQQGKKIRFIEKIGEPEYQRHGSNDLDGDQLDTEDMLEKLRKDMENFGGEEEKEQQEPEEELEESEPEPEDEDSEDIDEHRERKSDHLTSTQKARFENLTQRIHRKIVETFGQTCEYEFLGPIKDSTTYAEAEVRVYSRGAVYTIDFKVERGETPEQDEAA